MHQTHAHGPNEDATTQACARERPPRSAWARYVAAVLALLITQRLLSGLGNLVAHSVDTTGPDPDGWWAPLSLHHLVQGLLALGVLLALRRRLDVGLRLGDLRLGARIVAVVTGVIVVYLLGWYEVAHLLEVDPAVAVPPDAAARIGYLGFQLLLSGTAEELVFRALPIAVLAAIRPITLVRRWHLTLETIVAAALFAFAHVLIAGGTVTADPGQLAYSFVLGAVQGVAFQRTRSVLAPMVIHSLSNALVTAAAMTLG